MRRTAAALALSTAALVAPAAASAAAVNVAPSCYLSTPAQGVAPVPFNASGLTAGETTIATLTVGSDTAGSVSATADGAGNLTGSITSWSATFGIDPIGDVPATLTVTDAATGGVIGTAPVTLGNAAVSVANGPSNPKIKRNWKVSGLSVLTGKTTYYAFYLDNAKAKHGKVKVVGKQKLGKATGACGYLKAKKPLSPFKKTGTYAVYIQSEKTFSKTALDLKAGTVTIFRY
jgi:hypothetical protein